VNDESDADAPGRPSELARRISAGDRAAEAELVRRYGAGLEFLLRTRVREASLAADLCQDALIIVIERLRNRALDEPEKLAAFLRQTAVNLALGEARTHYRRNTHADSAGIEALADRGPLISDRIDREKLAQAVRELLAELNQARDRQILRRFYLTEEPKASICAALEVTPEHFDRVLYRARQRFRRILESHCGAYLDGRWRNKAKK
jgi:RNA polymerase sigma-70 factor (ECF subfamily)